MVNFSRRNFIFGVAAIPLVKPVRTFYVMPKRIYIHADSLDTIISGIDVLIGWTAVSGWAPLEEKRWES